MFKALVFSALVTSSAFAGHLDKVCESAIISPPAWEENLVAYFDAGHTVLSTHSGTIITTIPAPVKSILQDGLSIWILTPTNLVEINSAGDVLNTYPFAEMGENGRYALSMVKFGRKVIISRGYAGLVAFDLDKRETVWTNAMSGDDDGYPSGLTTDGENIFAAVATSMENGFTGIATVNPENGTITRRTKYDVARWGVMSTDAVAQMQGDNLILNNGGWIHLITKAQIQSDKNIRPRWVAKIIPQNQDVTAHYMILAGGFIIQDGQVIGCGAYTARENDLFVRKTKLFQVKLP